MCSLCNLGYNLYLGFTPSGDQENYCESYGSKPQYCALGWVYSEETCIPCASSCTLCPNYTVLDQES